MGETRIKKNEKLLKGWRRSNKGLERKAVEAQGVLGAEATECSLLQLRLFSKSCRNMDELIWQVDLVREHYSAEITR